VFLNTSVCTVQSAPCYGILVVHSSLWLLIYRSHHEKIVIIDYQICFLGGLDLCFGRYDTPDHTLGDYPSKIWPGKDYYNPRYWLNFVLCESIVSFHIVIVHVHINIVSSQEF